MAAEITPPRSIQLTRQQLAQFLPNSELIRAFEALSMDVSTSIPANEIEILSVAKLALALAGQAIALAEGGAQEEPLLIPGRDGAAGLAGAPGAVFVQDDAAQDSSIPHAAPAAIPVGGSRATDAWRLAIIAALVSRGIIVDASTP